MKQLRLRKAALTAMGLVAMLWITSVAEAQEAPKVIYRGAVSYDIHGIPTYDYVDGNQSRSRELDAVDAKTVSAPQGPNASSNSLNMAQIRSDVHHHGAVFPIANFTKNSSFAIVIACKQDVPSTKTFTFVDQFFFGDIYPVWGIGCDQNSSLVVTSRLPQNNSFETFTSTYRLWDSNMSPSYNPVSNEIDLLVVGSLQKDAKLRLDIFGLLDGRWIGNLNDAGWPVRLVKDANEREYAIPYLPSYFQIGADPTFNPPFEEDWFSSLVVWDAPLIESGVFPSYSPYVNTMTYDLRLYLNSVLFTSLPQGARDYVPCNSGHWLPETASKGELGPEPDKTFLCGVPPALGGYTRCALEGATCPIPGFLIYGEFEKDASGNYIPHFVSKRVSQPVSCSVSTFGIDPYPGVHKTCYRWNGPDDSTTTPPKSPLPYEWIACGTGSLGAPPECNLPKDAGKQIVFGALGRFIAIPATPGSTNLCNGPNDPAPNVDKTCFYQRKLKVTD